MKVELIFANQYNRETVDKYWLVLESFFKKHKMPFFLKIGKNWTNDRVNMRYYDSDIRRMPKNSVVLFFNVPLDKEKVEKVMSRGNIVYLIYHKAFDLLIDNNIYLKTSISILMDDIDDDKHILNSNTTYKRDGNLTIIQSKELGILDTLSYVWGHLDYDDKIKLREFRKFEKKEIDTLDDNTRF